MLRSAQQTCAACCALAAVLLLPAATAIAAGPASLAAGAASSLGAEVGAPGLHRIGGGGTLLRLVANGVILVDPADAGTSRTSMTEVQRVVKTLALPIRALVLTAAGSDQVSNVVQFVDAGIPVIVQRRAFERLAADERARGTAALHSITTYDNDYLLRVGEVEAEVEHVGSGRTGADSVVLFRELRVVAIGGLYTSGTPQPDCASGGSFAGWAAAIEHLLWFDFDVAVPSRGAPVGKPELAAFKATLEAFARRAGSSASVTSDCARPQL